MKKIKYYRNRWFYGLLVAFTLLLGGGGEAWAGSAPTLTVFQTPTLDKPWIEAELKIYDDTKGSNSFWTDKNGSMGVKMWVTRSSVLKGSSDMWPRYETVWPGSDNYGNDGGINDQRPNNGWWGNTYEDDNKNYTIRFYDPRKNGSYIYVTVVVYCWNLMGGQETITLHVEGDWKINGKGTNRYHLKANATYDASAIFANNSSNVIAERTSLYGMSYTSAVSSAYTQNPYTQTWWVMKDAKADNVTHGSNQFATAQLGSCSSYTMKWDTNSDYLPNGVTEVNKTNIRYWAKKAISDRGTFYWSKFVEGIIPGYMRPMNLDYESDKWKKSIMIKWDSDKSNNNTCELGSWAIFRRKASEEEGQQQCIASGLRKTNTSYTDTDVDLLYDTDYIYNVAFIPDGMNASNPVASLTKEVKASIRRTFDITIDDEKSVGFDNYIQLAWNTEAFGNTTSNEFKILRSENGGDWIQVGSVSVSNKKKVEYTWINDQVPSQCSSYRYKVTTTLMENMLFESEPTKNLNLQGTSRVTSLNTSMGAYAGLVKLQWEATQVGGENTNYLIQRRLLGTDDEWGTIYKTQGTSTTYYYEDNTALPGQYYEYMVTSSTDCQGSDQSTSVTNDGFCRATGTVSGRISYGTGTAVNGVKVTLKKNGDENDTEQYYSMRVDGIGAGVRLPLTDSKLASAFTNKAFSAQLYVRPDNNQGDKNDKPVFFDLSGNLQLYLGAKDAAKGYPVCINYKPVGSASMLSKTTDIYLEIDKFTHLTLTKSKSGVFKLYSKSIVADSIATKEYALNLGNIEYKAADASGISFGGAFDKNGEQGFYGYVDEMRMFSGKELSASDIQKNYNHLLAGTESGLFLYWPVDEGLTGQAKAYDYSKTSGVANSNHGIISSVSTKTTSKVYPSAEQLSLMAYTDSLGNYTIRGIPFSGEGTTYMVCPSLGIHKFSPIYQTRFIGASSLVYSGVDFSDDSSFPVSGKVVYENTTYPVEGCYLYVDNQICSKDGEPITTDSEGNFTISVPIGDHYISIKKQGHTFVNDGRFPADPQETGTTFTFEKKMTGLSFYDATLVNMAGRIVGGDTEANKPLGFGFSKNNIGTARIVLKALDDKYMLNVDSIKNGLVTTIEKAAKTLTCASTSTDINSNSWRGNGDDANKIFIETDPETGEFSALVPPLFYNVDSWNIKSNNSIDLGALPTIDLRNPSMEYSDSTELGDGNHRYYHYNGKIASTYYSTPVFLVKQSDNEVGAFGMSQFEYEDNFGSMVINDIYSVGENGKITYKYGVNGGHPLFLMNDPYTFNIEAYEEYVNKDTKNEAGAYPVDRVPLAGDTIVISNQLSSEQSVLMADGSIVNLVDNRIALDEDGKAVYVWKAGFPNISSPYTRTIAMDLEVNDRRYSWPGLTGINLGALPTGGNFVTAGPDKVLMVLRDPPGTNSSATWETGTVTTWEKSVGATWSTDTKVTTTTKLGATFTTSTGIGVAVINSLEAKNDLNVGINILASGEKANTTSTVTTVTKAISTSDEPEYVGAQGDLFIGTSTNMLFGLSNEVSFNRDAAGDVPSLQKYKTYTVSQSFKTAFNYTTNYIENVLIPNLEDMRNKMLVKATQNEIDNFKNTTKKTIYLTTLDKSDSRFGKNNHDKVAFGTKATSKVSAKGPSYTAIAPLVKEEGVVYEDSVLWINIQIETWKNQLKMNEEEKVRAFENREETLIDNFSFDSGAVIQGSETKEKSKGYTHDISGGLNIIASNCWGVEIQNTGVIWTLSTETGAGSHYVDKHDTTDVSTFSYVLKDNGGSDAISVDLYKSDNYSTIFRTRGGQTSAPYEGQVVTKYYQPGTTIMEATMQIEVPKIGVTTPSVTNVPSGSAANFTLQLSNESQINEDVYYKILAIDETNSNGAQLSIDGQVLTEGRNIKIPAGETITKALQLKQTNLGILEYNNIGIVLASQSQYDPTSTWEQIADTVYISAQFIPSSSPVKMELSNTLMNSSTGSDLRITFKDFDRNYYNLKAFRIQYKCPSDVNWKQLHEYTLDSKMVDTEHTYLDKVASVTFPLSMDGFSDGEYTFRVLSVSSYGKDEVTLPSEEITLVKDMAKPKPLGNAQPANGFLTKGDEMSVTFNEDIANGRLVSETNFTVSGMVNGSKTANDVALSGNNYTTPAAATEASINLANKDFATDMWVYVSGAGTILSHGNGNRKFNVGIDESNHLLVSIGDSKYTSTSTLETGKWIYLALSYANDGEKGTLNAITANDAFTTVLFKDQSVASYSGNGRLAVLKDIKANIRELTLWDKARDVSTLMMDMYNTKMPSTQNLIGYWKFDEGDGKCATDKSRSRNMVVENAEGWYMNVENKAQELNGSSYIDLSIGACTIPAQDDYAIEMWFNANQQAKAAKIFSVGNSTLSLGIEANGTLTLYSGTHSLKLGSANYANNAWHHFALNVLRNGMATVYIDGESVAQTAAANVNAIQGSFFTLGAQRTTEFNAESQKNTIKYGEYFKGCLDEVRIWNATMNVGVIRNNMKKRMTGKEAGLVAYYPFEHKKLGDGNQVVTEYWGYDMVANAKAQNSSDKIIVTGPALMPSKEAVNVPFSFVASERKIVINLTALNADPAQLEGNTIDVTIKGVEDMNGNACEPIKWCAYICQNQLQWDDNTIDVKTKNGEVSNFTATIVNHGATTEKWSITELPSWLSANVTTGSLPALSEQKIKFTISPDAQIGKHDATVRLYGNTGIEVPLNVNLEVAGDEPLWAVNESDYESNFTIFGQLKQVGVISENTSDVVAAFIDGECRGVAKPVYNPRYDTYFTLMTVFGNHGDEGKGITFKAWNADQGKIYPVVSCYLPNETKASSISYSDNVTYGFTTSPFIWNSENKIEQKTSLRKGWNWLSLYVENDDMSPSSMLQDISVDGNYVKGIGGYSQYSKSWVGSLSELSVGELYKVKSVEADKLTMVGVEVNSQNRPITLNEGWNWIGLNASYNIGLNQAFSELVPENNDQIKSQNSFAVYDGYEWIGTLKTLIPGQGYMYHTNTNGKSFHYPSKVAITGKNKVKASESSQQIPTTFVFDGSSYYKYQNNMTVIATVKDGDTPISGVEVAVYAGHEIREVAVSDNEGRVFLTIPGESVETLSIKVAEGGIVSNIIQYMNFSKNSALGTLDDPYLIQLNSTNGVTLTKDDANSDAPAYNTSGQRVDPDKYRGIMIKGSEKVYKSR